MKMIGRVVRTIQGIQGSEWIAPVWIDSEGIGFSRIGFSPLKIPSKIMTNILREALAIDDKARIRANGSAFKGSLSVALQIEASSEEKAKAMIKIAASYTELAKGFKKYAKQHLNFNDKDFEDIESRRAIILLDEE